MAQRLTYKFVKARFEHFAKELGLDIHASVKNSDGHYVTVSGTVVLDYNSIYGGYQVHLNKKGGGAKVLSGERKSASELIAWMDGAEYAAKLGAEPKF